MIVLMIHRDNRNCRYRASENGSQSGSFVPKEIPADFDIFRNLPFQCSRRRKFLFVADFSDNFDGKRLSVKITRKIQQVYFRQRVHRGFNRRSYAEIHNADTSVGLDGIHAVCGRRNIGRPFEIGGRKSENPSKPFSVYDLTADDCIFCTVCVTNSSPKIKEQNNTKTANKDNNG